MRQRFVSMLFGVIGTVAAGTAGAAPRLDAFHGHLSFGYSKLFADRAPGGSMSSGVGIDSAISPKWRAGVEVNFDLLGTRLEERGSLAGEVDYSVFEALALAHWIPSFHGPVGRISFGPGVFGAR